MSSKGKKTELDYDIDELLGELDDDGPTTKKPTIGKSSTLPKKANVYDDDFYKAIQKDIPSDSSDVSEADPKEIIAKMGDMDDMDSAIFGNKPKTQAVIRPPTRSGFNDVEKPKLLTPNTKTSIIEHTQLSTKPGSIQRSTSSNESTVSLKKKSKDTGDLFGDDDLLSGLGFDSTQTNNSEKKLDLFGNTGKNVTDVPSNKIENKILPDDLPFDKDIQFGAYAPSIGNPNNSSSRPSSRRSVRFEEEGNNKLDVSVKSDSTRPRSAPEKPVNNDLDSDWLGLSNWGQSKNSTLPLSTERKPAVDFKKTEKPIILSKKDENDDEDDWLFGRKPIEEKKEAKKESIEKKQPVEKKYPIVKNEELVTEKNEVLQNFPSVEIERKDEREKKTINLNLKKNEDIDDIFRIDSIPVRPVRHENNNNYSNNENHFKKLLEISNEQHDEQIKYLQDAHKKKINLMEQVASEREKRLENEGYQLKLELEQKIKLISQQRDEALAEKNMLREAYKKDLFDERQHTKELHRSQLDDLRKEHQEAIERLRLVKDKEIESVINAHDHSKSLANVLNQLNVNTLNLNEIRGQLQDEQTITFEEKGKALNYQENQLNNLKSQLDKQQHETDVERSRLQALVTKLEKQLVEQAGIMETDKWNLKREESRLQLLKKELEQERVLGFQKLDQEKKEISNIKDRLIEEEASILQKLHMERQSLAEEQMERQRNFSRRDKNEQEIEKIRRKVFEDKQELEMERKEFEREQNDLKTKLNALNRREQTLSESLNRFKQRSLQLEEFTESTLKMKKEALQAFSDAKKMEEEQKLRLLTIEAQLEILQKKEKQIAEEQLNLAKGAENKRSYLCVNCSTPVKDSDDHEVSETRSLQFTNQAVKLYEKLQSHQNSNTNFNAISKQLKVDRYFQMAQIEAQKDKQFLQDEQFFLQTLS